MRPGKGGYTLLELLVSLFVLIAGILPVVFWFVGYEAPAVPPDLSSGGMNVGVKIRTDSKLVFLAQQEADDTLVSLFNSWPAAGVGSCSTPTVTGPLSFSAIDGANYAQYYYIVKECNPAIPPFTTANLSVINLTVTAFYDSNGNGLLDAREENDVVQTQVSQRF